MKCFRETVAAMFLVATATGAWAQGGPLPQVLVMPPYQHIFVIIEENHTTDEIVPSAAAPNLTRFAQQYGYSWKFYAEQHPSEPNYVAMVGGDTFGIKDDDAYWCKPGSTDNACPGAKEPGYVDHTITAPSLASQLEAHHLTWKGYFEDIPEPASRVYRWPNESRRIPGEAQGLYAVTHNG